MTTDTPMTLTEPLSAPLIAEIERLRRELAEEKQAYQTLALNGGRQLAAKQAEIDRLREQLSMAGDKREEDAAAHMKEVEWWHKIAANVLTMIVTAIQGDVLSPAFGERLSDMLRSELAAHDDGEGDK